MNKIDAERMSKIVADRLQERIIRERIATGGRLPTEPQLMEAFGVSRTVIREATALLVSRGIVEVRPRRGLTVRAPDGHGLADSLVAQLRMSQVSLPQLLQVRITLESAIARMAAENRDDNDLHLLRKNVIAMGSDELQQDSLVSLDLAFHDLLASATKNPFFSLVTRPINQLLRSLYIDRAGYVSLRKVTVSEHEAILLAIENGNAEAADSATRRHLDRVGQSVELLIAERKRTES
jgi:GntR family transcriptional regulator, transcriptional repressor for pyruvate dehydrogenase complex